MGKAIIQVTNVSKKYRLGPTQPYLTLRDSLVNMLHKPFGFLKFDSPITAYDKLGKNEFWALKDINFKVSPGEVVGIIGRNGAGKSTLLRLISRITPPSKGEIAIKGRVASLLEVGTGFHPELSGRENIFLNGAILGMKRNEIKRKFGEIVDFSEIGKFIDTPVKFFSSGMYVRLAFAVAAHLTTEILLVDEVLAVGDAQFQKKCLGKMEEITQNEGRTILFVSHNMGSIQSLCSRCILFQEGKVILDDIPHRVIQSYLADTKDRSEIVLQPKKGISIQVLKIWLENLDGKKIDKSELGNDTLLHIQYSVTEKVKGFSPGVIISRQGTPIMYSLESDKYKSPEVLHTPGLYQSTVRLPTSIFKEGRHTAQIVLSWKENISNPDAFINFSIISTLQDLTHKAYRSDRLGIIYKILDWKTGKIE